MRTGTWTVFLTVITAHNAWLLNVPSDIEGMVTEWMGDGWMDG